MPTPNRETTAVLPGVVGRGGELGSAGTFTMKRKIRVTSGEDSNVRTIDGNWEVTSGTGAYENLQARGKISGTVPGFPPAETFELTYTGNAAID